MPAETEMDGARERIRRARARLATLLVASFAAALFAPHVDEFLRDAEARGPANHELRAPAPWPGSIHGLWSARQWPEGFSSWYEDRMGLRDVLLAEKNGAYLEVFGVSPSPKVLPGKQGFLFYTGDHTLEIARGLRPFSARELAEFRALFEAREAWCRTRGFHYLLVLCPNKETIYPELLPGWFEKLGPTRLEQLAAELERAGSPVELLDLTATMRAARELEKPRLHVYSVLGTHWDGLGSWAAYHAVAARLARDFPAVRPLAWEELEPFPQDANSDAWTEQLYIPGALDPHSTFVRFPETARRRSVVQREEGAGTRGRSVVDDPALPRLAVSHDSFGTIALDLLTEHASNAITIFDVGFDAERIAKCRPDFVIDWYVERILDAWDPADARPPEEPGPQVAPEIVWRLDAHAPDAGLTPLGAARVRGVGGETGSAELEVAIETTGDLVELPRIAAPPGRGAVLHVELVSPAATVFDVFVRRPGDEAYLRRNARGQPLPRGDSEFDVPLDPTALAAPLRFRPGRKAGTYRISRLEVWLTPPRAGAGTSAPGEKQ